VSLAVAGAIAAFLLVAASRRVILVYSAVRLYRTASATRERQRIWIACACRNESARLPGLIASISSLPYRGNHELVLIDDGSTDDSASLMETARAASGTRIHVRLLSGEQRGKADALRAGLQGIPLSGDDILLVLDADHRLRADALDNVANYFADPAVTAVSMEHPVRDAGRSLVAAYCFLEAAVGETVTSRGQHGLNLAPKLAGSWACRPAAFERLYPAGWQLADDTMFSAAIVADGGRIVHAADVVATQEVPSTLRGYMDQHIRWGSGYAESAGRGIRMRAAQGGSGLLARIDAVATHAGYFERPLLLMLVVIASIAWFAGSNAAPAAVAAAVIAAYAVVILVQVATALSLSRAPLQLRLMSIASLPMVAADFAVSLAGAAAGVMNRRVGWSTDKR
jgi:cellulose synthase/poly-beta-1,6-N-acetylglucosamine synthase-like glycosyltransferase